MSAVVASQAPPASGGEEEEDEEIPEDLLDLSPEEQQKQIKIRAFSQMALGTILVSRDLNYFDVLEEMTTIVFFFFFGLHQIRPVLHICIT
jgi:hypothetical protein